MFIAHLVLKGLIFEVFSSSYNISIANINRYPAIGSPCLHPLPIFKGFEMFPLITVTAEKLVFTFTPRMILIHSKKTLPKFNTLRAVKVKSKLTLSKAFTVD